MGLVEDMLEALLQSHHGHQKAHGEHVQGNVALGSGEGILGVEDQVLHASEQGKGDDPGDQGGYHPAHGDLGHLAPFDELGAEAHHGEADDGADDGVGGGYRPAHHTGDQQPDPGGEQRRKHAVDHQVGYVRHRRGIDDAAADGAGHLPTGQVGAEELEHHGHQDGLAQGQRLGTDRGAHGVGHIVGPHPPGHEESEHTGQNDQDLAVFSE